jgi:transposase InsO family protein
MPNSAANVIEFLKASGIRPIRTSIRSPWQNGIAERWMGSCRREMTDHVIPLNEQHLKRLANEYLAYYHDDRTHKTLGKQTPDRRPIQPRPAARSEILALPRIGGLHHRYCWTEAA